MEHIAIKHLIKTVFDRYDDYVRSEVFRLTDHYHEEIFSMVAASLDEKQVKKFNKAFSSMQTAIISNVNREKDYREMDINRYVDDVSDFKVNLEAANANKTTAA